MKTIDGVNFYTKEDSIYSRGGFLVLDDKLNPCGVYLPDISDGENADDKQLSEIASAYKVMTGV